MHWLHAKPLFSLSRSLSVSEREPMRIQKVIKSQLYAKFKVNNFNITLRGIHVMLMAMNTELPPIDGKNL